jgi:hypothetical protein
MFTVLVTSMCMASNVAISHDNVIEYHNEGRDVYGAGNEHVHGQQRCDKS